MLLEVSRVIYLRAESDRSNLPKYSAGARLGIHSESHGSEIGGGTVIKIRI